MNIKNIFFTGLLLIIHTQIYSMDQQTPRPYNVPSVVELLGRINPSEASTAHPVIHEQKRTSPIAAEANPPKRQKFVYTNPEDVPQEVILAELKRLSDNEKIFARILEATLPKIASCTHKLDTIVTQVEAMNARLEKLEKRFNN